VRGFPLQLLFLIGFLRGQPINHDMPPKSSFIRSIPDRPRSLLSIKQTAKARRQKDVVKDFASTFYYHPSSGSG
jgi:hypothetical protein